MEFKAIKLESKKNLIKTGCTFICDIPSKNDVLRKVKYCMAIDAFIVIRYEKGDLKIHWSLEELNEYYEKYATNVRLVKIESLTYEYKELQC